MVRVRSYCGLYCDVLIGLDMVFVFLFMDGMDVGVDVEKFFG